jgi:hypothetical protein
MRAAAAFGSDRFRRSHAEAATASRRLAPAPLVIGAFVLAAAALVLFRDGVVRSAPPMGALYRLVGLPANPMGMEVHSLRARLVREEDAMILAIEGDIVNLRRSVAETPILRLILRAADGRDLYAWRIRPRKARLDARARLGFGARLAAPPDGAMTVVAVLEDARAAPRAGAGVSRPAKMP